MFETKTFININHSKICNKFKTCIKERNSKITYWPIHLQTNVLTYLLTYLLIYTYIFSFTYLLAYLLTFADRWLTHFLIITHSLAVCLNSCLPTCSIVSLHSCVLHGLLLVYFLTLLVCPPNFTPSSSIEQVLQIGMGSDGLERCRNQMPESSSRCSSGRRRWRCWTSSNRDLLDVIERWRTDYWIIAMDDACM